MNTKTRTKTNDLRRNRIYTIEQTDGHGDPGDCWRYVDTVKTYSPAAAARYAAVKYDLENINLRVTGGGQQEVFRFLYLH